MKINIFGKKTSVKPAETEIQQQLNKMYAAANDMKKLAEDYKTDIENLKKMLKKMNG